MSSPLDWISQRAGFRKGLGFAKGLRVIGGYAHAVQKRRLCGFTRRDPGMSMSPTVLLTGYCLLIIAASVAGGKLSSLLRMTHTRTQLLMSGVGGLMIGIALLHLLP